jgi:hypothetical protein
MLRNSILKKIQLKHSREKSSDSVQSLLIALKFSVEMVESAESALLKNKLNLGRF